MIKQLRSLNWSMFIAGAGLMLTLWEAYMGRYGQAGFSLGLTIYFLGRAMENQQLLENRLQQRLDALNANIKILGKNPRSLSIQTQRLEDTDQDSL